jgi:hypothetical protein
MLIALIIGSAEQIWEYHCRFNSMRYCERDSCEDC